MISSIQIIVDKTKPNWCLVLGDGELLFNGSELGTKDLVDILKKIGDVDVKEVQVEEETIVEY